MLGNTEEKQCTLCKKVKPIAEFVSAFSAGFTNRCAECRKRGQRAHSKYVNKNREKINEWYVDYTKKRISVEPKPGFLMCPRCWRELSVDEFPVGFSGQRKKMCIDCRAYYAEHQGRWREKYPEKVLAQQGSAANRRRENRRRCFEHYGLACSCCGEAHYEFLTIDHVDGRGNIHRRELPSNRLCPWLIKQGFPPGFRTLCWNCNWGCRLNNGICPHEIERVAA